MSSIDVEALDLLTGHVGDELEVLVDVEHRQLSQFGGRCDQQIRNGRRSMLPAFREDRLELERSVLAWGQPGGRDAAATSDSLIPMPSLAAAIASHARRLASASGSKRGPANTAWKAPIQSTLSSFRPGDRGWATNAFIAYRAGFDPDDKGAWAVLFVADENVGPTEFPPALDDYWRFPERPVGSSPTATLAPPDPAPCPIAADPVAWEDGALRRQESAMSVPSELADNEVLLARLATLERRLDEQEAELARLRRDDRPPGRVVSPGVPVTPGPLASTGEPAPARPADRRHFVRAAAAATGIAVSGAAILAKSSPASAANGSSLIIGSSLNTGTQATGIAVSGTQAPYGLGVTDNGLNSLTANPSVFGHAKGQNFGIGVLGLAEGLSTGVEGRSANGPAVNAVSTAGIGVRAQSTHSWGVHTRSTHNVGIYAVSDNSTGVYGESGAFYGGEFVGGLSALRVLGSLPPPPSRPDSHRDGEINIDGNGDLWFCTATGTPGSWRKLSGSGTAGAFHVLPSSARVYDSRAGFAPSNVTKGSLGANQERPVDCKFGSAVPPGALAVMVNLTIISASAAGFLAAFKNGLAWPGNSSLNWDHSGQATANSAVVALDTTASFRVRASNPVDFIVDVIGYYR